MTGICALLPISASVSVRSRTTAPRSWRELGRSRCPRWRDWRFLPRVAKKSRDRRA